MENVEKNDILRVLCLGNKHREKYPEQVRHFCLALHYYSPRAYEYVRKAFNNHIPNEKSIKNWLSNSDLKADPGIQSYHIEKLKKNAYEFEVEHEKKMVCSLVFDEMSIRQQIYFSSHQLDYVGYVNEKEPHEIAEHVNNTEGAEKKIAKQAIVFILNGINVNFEFPVAYYFIDTLDKTERKTMLNDVIRAITQSGVKISNLTFDGYASNIGMCELLGADLNVYSQNFQTFIPNPVNGEKIYIILDPCHMVKLMRNLLARKKIIYDGKNDKIEWQYFVSLYEHAKIDSIRFHKLTKKHMQWDQNIMNVRIAVETLSETVASYMEYLMKQSHPEFVGAGPTIKFIRTVNSLFDVFNSKDVSHPDIFKRSLNSNNARIVFNFFETATQYLKNLQIEETRKIRDKQTKEMSERKEIVPLLQTKSKTPIRGFIIDMKSMQSLYKEYVDELKIIEALSTYYLLQDVVELFFGRIRSCGGYNNNPNVHQFKGAYRKLLSNIKIVSSELTNCRVFDANLQNPKNFSCSDIYTVSSNRTRIVPTDTEEFKIKYEKQKDDIISEVNKIVQMDSFESNDSPDFSIAYVASTIEQKILNSSAFYCDKCRSIFGENEKIGNDIDANVLKWKPCFSTFQICKSAEHFLNLYRVQSNENKFDFKVLYCLIFRTLEFDALFNKSEFKCDPAHKDQLIKSIVEQYIARRAANISKDITLNRFEHTFRQKLNHLVTVAGQ